MWRCQPPVYTPVPYRALWRATVGSPGAAPHRRRLAALLRTAFDADRVVLTDSGTDALTLALRVAAAGARGRCRVAVPAFTCFDVATAAVGAGAEILLYDVDPGTLTPDLDSLAAACAAGAAACVVSPLYGVPVDWPAIEAVAASHGTVPIEDAAQGHGALLAGRPLGAWGPISVLSFGRGKGWTGGGGGALLLRRRHAQARLPEPPVPGDRSGAGALGRALAQRALGTPLTYRLPSGLPFLGLGATRYRNPRPVRGMASAAASLLLATHAAADAEAANRRAMAAQLIRAIAELGVAVPRVIVGGRAGYLRLPVWAPMARRQLEARGGYRALGVAPSYPWTLSDIPAVRQRLAPGSGRVFPGARDLARDLLTLPTHSLVRASDRTTLVSYLREVFGVARTIGGAAAAPA